MRVLLLAVLLLTAVPAASEAQVFPNQSDSATIAVSGLAEVRVPPGHIVLFATFAGQGPLGPEALAAATAARDRAAAGLRDAGVPEEAITALGAALGAEINRGMRGPAGPGEQPRHEALLGLRVEVESSSRMDAVLAALASAGVDNLTAVVEPGEPAEARRQAARAAMANARAEADALAAAAGVRLGPLISVTSLPDYARMAMSPLMQLGGMPDRWARLIPIDVAVRSAIVATWAIVR